MLWRGATSAWLQVGAVATSAHAASDAAVVQALLRGMVLAPLTAIFAFAVAGSDFASTQQCSNAIDLWFNGVTLVAAFVARV